MQRIPFHCHQLKSIPRKGWVSQDSWVAHTPASIMCPCMTPCDTLFSWMCTQKHPTGYTKDFTYSWRPPFFCTIWDFTVGFYPWKAVKMGGCYSKNKYTMGDEAPTKKGKVRTVFFITFSLSAVHGLYWV